MHEEAASVDEGIRTPDFLLRREALYPLSYVDLGGESRQDEIRHSPRPATRSHTPLQQLCLLV